MGTVEELLREALEAYAAALLAEPWQADPRMKYVNVQLDHRWAEEAETALSASS